jgi:hypothetical protein
MSLNHEPIAEVTPGGHVYAEGWQTWSPIRLYRVGETSERARPEIKDREEWAAHLDTYGGVRFRATISRRWTGAASG